MEIPFKTYCLHKWSIHTVGIKCHDETVAESRHHVLKFVIKYFQEETVNES